MGTEPTRRRVEIWIDTDDRQIKCRGDEAHTEVIQGVGEQGMGRRRGAYAVIIPEKGIRLVFCGTREAEDFLGDWARLATGSGRARGANDDADARDDDDDASAVARWRAARARERVEKLRARVIARASERADAGGGSAKWDAARTGGGGGAGAPRARHARHRAARGSCGYKPRQGIWHGMRVQGQDARGMCKESKTPNQGRGHGRHWYARGRGAR